MPFPKVALYQIGPWSFENDIHWRGTSDFLIQKEGESKCQKCIWSLKIILMCTPSGEPLICLLKVQSFKPESLEPGWLAPAHQPHLWTASHLSSSNTELLGVSWKHHAFAHNVFFPEVNISPCNLGAFYIYFKIRSKNHQLSHMFLVTPNKN